MNRYKLVALDMDGTLLNDESLISEANSFWIAKALEAGVIVIFSTGRGFAHAIGLAEDIKLETPMITVNGSEIWTKPYELLYRTTLDSSYVEKLHKLALRYPEAWYWANTIGSIRNKEYWVQDKQIADFEWMKFGYYIEDLQALAEIREEIESWDSLEISNSSIYNIEVNPKGVSKASALAKLCNHLNITMEEVIAVGDSLNDIRAIQEAGLGIAMDNAQQAVKDAADAITASNNDDGVAKVIQKYIFNM